MNQSSNAPPKFLRLTRGRFIGMRLNHPDIPTWYIRRIAEDTSRPYFALCAQAVLDGSPPPSRDDIEVLALGAAKEKQKEVISSR